MSGRWEKAATSGGLGRRGPADPDDPGLDPYVRWALATNGRGFERRAQKTTEPVRFIACAPSADVLLQLLLPASKRKAAGLPKSLTIPSIYGRAIPGTQRRTLHFTGTISRYDMLHWLVPNPLGLRWRLALPLRDAGKAAAASSKGLFGPTRDAVNMVAKNCVDAQVRQLARLNHAAALDGVIGLIDAGCPFLNDAFAIGQGTRVAALWDQGAHLPVQLISHKKTGWPWKATQHFDHGRELGPAALDVIARASRSSQQHEETLIYRGLDYLIDYQDERRRVWYGTHGGHLMDMAAGNVDPLAKGAAPDLAADALLVFVDLPMSTAMDSSGGSLSAHLLDGVRYILSLCKPGSPVVINISYGAQAGPHDGSTLLEEALDELLEQVPQNLAIVLAAGNARQLACHARRTVCFERSALLRVMLPPGDMTDSFVELWFDPPETGALQSRVRSPNQQWSPWVSAGEQVVVRSDDTNQEVMALLRQDDTVPNGRRSMVLLAVCATAQPRDLPCPLAEPGVWEIEVQWANAPNTVQGRAGVPIDAWIERDDPARNSGAERPHFIDQERDDDRNTLSNIASGGGTVRVGGFNLATRLAAPYSALGPAGIDRPNVLAACEEDEASPNIAAAATRSSEVVRLSGTSVAAPVLARRLYNVMREHGPFTAVELQEVATLLALSGADPCIKPVAED